MLDLWVLVYGYGYTHVKIYYTLYEPETVDLYPAPNRIYCQQPLNWNHDG